MVLYVESPMRMNVRVSRDVFVKAFSGSKRHALKVYGFPDDDYDFAVRFLKTCRQRRASICVAVVRDQRIATIIRNLLSKSFADLQPVVEVIRIPFASTSEWTRNVIEVIARIHGPER